MADGVWTKERRFELSVPLQCSSHPEPLRHLSLRTLCQTQMVRTAQLLSAGAVDLTTTGPAIEATLYRYAVGDRLDERPFDYFVRS
jgi:hypothetical protein